MTEWLSTHSMEEIHYKALTHAMIELASPNLECELAGWRPWRADGAHEVQRWSAGEFPLTWESSLSIVFKPSADWTRTTHCVMDGNLLYSEFKDLSISLIQKFLTVQLTIAGGYPGPPLSDGQWLIQDSKGPSRTSLWTRLRLDFT